MILVEAKQILKNNGFICEKKNNEVVLLDTLQNISIENARDWANDEDLTEDDERYWDIVNEYKEMELEDFKEDAAFNFDLGWCLVTGSAELWNGRADGGAIVEIESGEDLLDVLYNRDINDAKIYIDKDGLQFEGYHHDGTNAYTIFKLSERGINIWNKYEEKGGNKDDRELHEKLLKTKGTLIKITPKMVGAA